MQEIIDAWNANKVIECKHNNDRYNHWTRLCTKSECPTITWHPEKYQYRISVEN